MGLRSSAVLPASNPLAIIALVAGNLFPLYAVLFLGWSVFSVLLLYWVESAIIGLYTLIEIILIGRKTALFFAPFFCIHYGLFMTVHMVFLWGLFGPGSLHPLDYGGPGAALGNGVNAAVLQSLLPGVIPLFAIHGVSFLTNIISDWRQRNVQQAMARPYGRIVFMHLTLILGGFLFTLIGAPGPAFAIVVVAKIAVDIMSHLRTHPRKLAAPTIRQADPVAGRT